MANLVVIKSYQYGISLHLDEEADFGQLLAEVAAKFRESAAFFKDAQMALSLEGRSLNTAEEKAIIAAIRENSDINILCLIGKNEETEQEFIKALGFLNYGEESGNAYHLGPLRDGQVLQKEDGVVLIGDVHPGAAIISTHDIIVIGGLYGEAYAGSGGDESRFVMALEMAPEKLTIGGYKYKLKDKVSKWSIKMKVQPKIAYVREGQVVAEPITKELLRNIFNAEEVPGP
ncbi:MAG: septum site-determining protein MinC [Lachnospiraceae bacterium]|jgi:septum site-determining protein MinC|nr:septum site-determining protein MinC [Lachnospiraceae bacterium]